MAFPTTSLLDDFTRANATSLGANWTDSLNGGAATGWRIVSNEAQPDTTNLFESSYYNVSTYGPDSEVYYTILHTPSTANRIMQYLRLTSPGASLSAYSVLWGSSSSASTHQMEKDVAGVNSAVGSSFSQALAAGDQLGFEAIGSTLKAYRKASGGSWTELASRTDTSLSGAGYLGLMSRDGPVRVDDFSGGTVVTGGAPAPRLLGLTGAGT